MDDDDELGEGVVVAANTAAMEVATAETSTIAAIVVGECCRSNDDDDDKETNACCNELETVCVSRTTSEEPWCILFCSTASTMVCSDSITCRNRGMTMSWSRDAIWARHDCQKRSHRAKDRLGGGSNGETMRFFQDAMVDEAEDPHSDIVDVASGVGVVGGRIVWNS